MQGAPLGGINCDVHPALPGIAALLPYLEPYWREQITVRGIDGLDLAFHSPRIPANARPDWRLPDGAKPGSELDAFRAQALDAFGTRLAIATVLYGVQALHNEHFATALARAINQWVAAEWLDREPRLRASIVIAPQDPQGAAEEIERCAADPRFVQIVLLAMAETPLGKRALWPIYEAAARHRLPVGIHAGTTTHHATTSNGWPSYHLEDTLVQPQAFQAQILSFIHEGAFKKFPTLKLVLMEAGFTWLPNFIWRANKTWRGVRAEVPWVDRPPGELIREHVRFTLQPSDAPPDAAGMERVLDQIGTDSILLFSTDYPHWHFEPGADPFPAGFSPALRRRVLEDNPLETYPRLQEVFA